MGQVLFGTPCIIFLNVGCLTEVDVIADFELGLTSSLGVENYHVSLLGLWQSYGRSLS